MLPLANLGGKRWPRRQSTYLISRTKPYQVATGSAQLLQAKQEQQSPISSLSNSSYFSVAFAPDYNSSKASTTSKQEQMNDIKVRPKPSKFQCLHGCLPLGKNGHHVRCPEHDVFALLALELAPRILGVHHVGSRSDGQGRPAAILAQWPRTNSDHLCSRQIRDEDGAGCYKNDRQDQ